MLSPRTKERNMTDNPSPDHEANASSEHSNCPSATAKEKLTGGMRFDDIIGLFPADAFDGFEEEIRELRRWSSPTREPWE
jgi:hypothetical protein